MENLTEQITLEELLENQKRIVKTCQEKLLKNNWDSKDSHFLNESIHNFDVLTKIQYYKDHNAE